MAIDERQINALVDAVVQKLAPRLAAQMPAQAGRADYVVTYGQHRSSGCGTGRRGIFEDVDSAVAAARDAHEQLLRLDLETRAKMIQAMREVTARNAEDLSRRAVEETKLGRVEDKIQKNLLVAWKTPGIEILRPTSYTGDHGLTLIERAPFGVIAAITPTTNPTETILCNAIGMLAGGNTVVFNVHPSAKRVSRYHVEMLNDAIVAAGGPENCICSVAEPTIESSQALMKHKGTRLVVVTGGPAVVKTAMASGKRAICAGPGNPPAVVDETAHIERAGRDIVRSASFDNNVICILEKEVFAVASIADRLKEAMCAHGAYEVKGEAIRRLEKLVIAEDGAHPAKDWVGRDAAKIARAAGIDVPEKTRLLLAEVDAMHPFVQVELLMPVMGFVRVPTVDDAIACALQAEHGFGHTATMHSTNIDNLSRMARAVNTSIFVKNGPALAGLGVEGEGYTSFTIASPTGEGITTALSFTRERRCTLKDSFRIV